jgi:hypothetical protein
MPENKLNKLLLAVEGIKPEDIDKIGTAFAAVLASLLSHYTLRRFLRDRGFSKREAKLATNALSSAAWLISYNVTAGHRLSEKLDKIKEK